MLSDAGYNVEHAIVNATQLGVAQNRTRLLCTAVRRPLATHIAMAR